MERYDAEVSPVAKEWLALDPDERTLLVERYHRDARITLAKRARPFHALIHTVVENQLALEDQIIVRETLSRLTSAGLTRHEAIHAIGSVLIGYFNNLLGDKKSPPEGHAPYYAALRELDAKKWRKG
jgi:hypothetical protein